MAAPSEDQGVQGFMEAVQSHMNLVAPTPSAPNSTPAMSPVALSKGAPRVPLSPEALMTHPFMMQMMNLFALPLTTHAVLNIIRKFLRV
ncbi:hypothetical protein M758_UG107700 [Ceratodon purpureus]|nr:hypothetical protein M758_UG107700 [Ceratodon purpureus]